ncbi:hypothetical protein [Kangiella sediminilitoris]|uniref:CbiN domain protein n=1 Tax=Kangiella sediminilitoris TaxID=1144748 RepID=A0A1B3B7L2_9GAMM|nr:hypothetical protein [Kangiella sediminilitoris]AOE48781.1 hypothetical protein KS2013_49 [Kangiella sediminilitoris]
MKNIIVIIFLLTASYEVLACSCRMGGVDEKLSKHEEVFSGVVESVKYLDDENVFGDQKIIVTFNVTKTWKGSGQVQVLHTADNGAGCFGYWFEEGEEYLIYAFKQKSGKLNTMWCGGVIPKNYKSNDFTRETSELNELTE